jgi:hypothetical protein
MQTVPESVKLCMTTIINTDAAMSADALASSPLVASFSTDGYSESYGSAEEQKAVINAAIDRQIKEMLYGDLDDSGVPLLYRGLDR